jgi:hypothetical protein
MKASMKPAASLCLVVVVILGSILVSPAGAQVIDRTGNLRADVFAHLTFPSRDSDQYCLPTPGSLGAPGTLEVWRQAVDATLRGDLMAAANVLQGFAPCPPLRPSYKVVRYTDKETQRTYHLLIEADAAVKPKVVTGWGTYFFDPSPARELSIEVPHPVADAFTDRQGFDAFLQLHPRSFLFAGTHRCASTTKSQCTGPTPTCGSVRASDPPHGAIPDHPEVTNAFQVVHEALFGFVPRMVYLQLHGNATCCADALLSNTTSTFTVIPGGNVERLLASLEAVTVHPPPDRPLNFRVCSSRPEAVCNLCGTNNMQGRGTNGSTANACQLATGNTVEQFIHIEQTLRMRQEDPSGRTVPLHQVLIEAIRNTIFTQEEAPMLAPSRSVPQ